MKTKSISTDELSKALHKLQKSERKFGHDEGRAIKIKAIELELNSRKTK